MSYLKPQPDPRQSPRNLLNTTTNDTSTFEVTIRFSAAIPDLPLSIPVDKSPNTATLKQLIRTSLLPSDLATKRIRLIHAGKAFDDATPLSTSLKRVVSRPPSRIATPGPYDSGADTDSELSKAKGKLPVRDPPSARVYIHCSIGDVTLSVADLEAEAALANPASTDVSSPEQTGEVAVQDEATSTTPAPRGFDRLLNAGFTPSEIANLRLQFMSIQSHTHTPDTMPSPNTLRALEDQWLDSSNANSSLVALDDVSGNSGTTTGEDDGGRGALDDMLWGTTVGFFWPVACFIWGLREDGIFSPRRKIAIIVGIVLNLGLGFVRWGG